MAVGGGIAYAAIPGDGGVIHACYKTSNGDIHVIDPSATCAENETRLTWNQVGLRGEAGPQGQPGPQGPQGPKGIPAPAVAFPR